ncbi:hypothetical protein OOJ91_03425 [Micromonospora lupini]|uniref:hypothetical protein n=1 Tax=Micromonospora lupini TaxID=285679 RepID=UPI002251DD95|nr:hypothetical protein [Micromonospora lupini]MCX5064924.1 hypothetical protein [Micromonospora lupini]
MTPLHSAVWRGAGTTVIETLIAAGPVNARITDPSGLKVPLPAPLNGRQDLAAPALFRSLRNSSAYRGDLLAFAAHHDAGPGELTTAPVRAYLAETAGLAPAPRKRKRAAVLRRRPAPLDRLLHRRRCRPRHPPAAPRPHHRSDQRRSVHRGRPPPPRHASTETTQLYTLLDDKVADAEIRAARRRRDWPSDQPCR